MTKRYVLAIDQGTTSTRAIVFDHAGRSIASGQREHRQIFPRPGWAEHDPLEIWANTREVIGTALARADINRHQLAAVGITNQRETTVVWDRRTGEPVHNAIVWQDTRTQPLVERLGAGDADRFRASCGLPLATYFSGPKVAWLLDSEPGLRARAETGELAFGTMDSWLVWQLTGGPRGGVHVTDVTNASRTMLMNLASLQWDTAVADAMGIPAAMLPRICSSSQVYGAGSAASLLIDTPIAGILGDQQAAAFGQACIDAGQAKNTYGTGCFLLMNTGTRIVRSRHGLLTTLAYPLGEQPPVYALEGSIAVAGSLIQWLRDALGLIGSAAETEALAATVPDNGGAYIVPAFSGLFAPHWRPDARGVIVGLTSYVNRAHLVRAALESAAYQTREVVEAMQSDSGTRLAELKVDGGMTANEVLMGFQADLLGVPVVRPVVTETTALGAAYAAGIAVGHWNGTADVVANWAEGRRWLPGPAASTDHCWRQWRKAVDRTLNWVDPADPVA